MKEEDQYRLQCVKEHLDFILTYGRDCYRDPATPLFADEVDFNTKKHWVTKGEEGQEIVPSNLARQQNLLRSLTALSRLIGDEKYKKAAEQALQYHFNELADSSGLLQWGGHRWMDLITLQYNGENEKGLVHELKNHLPYYELMFEVNPVATQKFIHGFWNAHVFDWNNLEISRHGEYGLAIGELWDNSFSDPLPFRETKGLSFLNTGNDLIYSAGMLYKTMGEEGAWIWGKRLAKMYVAARHPETGLGSYQFTQAMKREEPIDDPTDPRFTHSGYGDRSQRQFGPEFGDFVLEGRMLLRGQAETIYVQNALMQMNLVEQIGEDAQELLQWTMDGLKAFYRYGYMKEINHFRPMLTDGRDLTNYELKRSGYHGPKGKILESYWANYRFLHSYARAAILGEDMELWSMAREIAKANDLGDLGEKPGEQVKANVSTKVSDANALLVMVEIYKATPHPDYLALARSIGNNLVKEKKGMHFDQVEPLALLALQEVIG